MSRKVRFITGHIYHIYNRGVEKRDVFLADADRWRFLQGLFVFNDVNVSSGLLWDLEQKEGSANFKTIKEYFKKNPVSKNPLVRIFVDCLMPNHFHLILQQLVQDGISKFMHKLGVGYTKYFNKKYNRVGPLFQGPFKAVMVEDDFYLKYLVVILNIL